MVAEKKRGGRVGDKKRKGESSSERNIACHPLGGKVNWVKCSTLPANRKRRMLNGCLWSLSLCRLRQTQQAESFSRRAEVRAGLLPLPL